MKKGIKILFLVLLTLISSPGESSFSSTIVINNIYFHYGGTEFADFYKPSYNLDKILWLMEHYPDVGVEIEGHQDVKEKKFNLLSFRRAKKVFDELVKRGADKNKLRIGFYNWSVPHLKLTSNYTSKETPPEEIINQRVEFYIFDVHNKSKIEDK